MLKTIQRKYAKLIVKTGANVQKGQAVRLYINVDQYAFAELITEECYKAGAARVDIDWMSQPLTKLNYKYRSIKSLSTVLPFEEAKLKMMSEEYPCRIIILSDDPDGLKGVNRQKMQKSQIARYPVIKPYRDAIENKHQWTIAAVPSYEWAKKVFPEYKKSVAYEKLWNAILSTVYVTRDNSPEEEWKTHNEQFKEKCKWLNEQRFDYLIYKSQSSGTDFTCSLIPQGHWCGGSEKTVQGIEFNPNLPTEEIFTSPMKGKCEGILHATKPLSYEGELIEDFYIEFHDGKATSWRAEKGQALLDKMLTMDEGAKMVGELALIPQNSPINQAGILYYETLFDENASCHVALGEGFNDCIDGYEQKTNEECKALGINESMIHVDFMIGAPDLMITGVKDGKAVPIFINGNWA